jgi:hypothetical protein
VRSRIARFGVAVALAVSVVSVSAGAALAGEITGNGKLLEVKGKSECAFSGQEDLQWYFDDANEMPKPVPTKGEPARAQSWGQIPKADRDFIAEMFGAHPGNACNPSKAGAE